VAFSASFAAPMKQSLSPPVTPPPLDPIKRSRLRASLAKDQRFRQEFEASAREGTRRLAPPRSRARVLDPRHTRRSSWRSQRDEIRGEGGSEGGMQESGALTVSRLFMAARRRGERNWQTAMREKERERERGGRCTVADTLTCAG
jgi:hypothetical protein